MTFMENQTRSPLPNDIEVEESLLACILIDGFEILNRCIEAGVKPSSFYVASHGAVYEMCTDMMRRGIPIDAASLTAELRTARQLDSIGGYPFIAQISRRVPTTLQAGYWIGRVAEYHQRRELIRASARIADACRNYSGGGVNEAVKKSFADLLSIVSGSDPARARKFVDVVREAERRAQAVIETGKEPSGETISFGFEKVDAKFSPMRPGELVIVAGRPSLGKSSAMRWIVANEAEKGTAVIVQSLEVTPEDVALQLAGSKSGISYKNLFEAHPREQTEFLAALRQIALPNLHVFDCDRSFHALVARARTVHATTPIGLIAVDYLGLIEDCSPSRGETATQAIGKITKGLKALASELKCVVIVLAQLNRSPMTDGNREPRLSDLRDSGNIEQDADRVIFMHRPDEDKTTGCPQRDSESSEERPSFYQEWIQAKGRNVGTGIVGFHFKRETTTFVPVG